MSSYVNNVLFFKMTIIYELKKRTYFVHVSKTDKPYREKILEHFFFTEIEYTYSESLEILLIFKLKPRPI